MFRNANLVNVVSKKFIPTFDLTSGYIANGSSSLAGMPGSDWCIEGWIYPTGVASSYGPVFFQNLPSMIWHLQNWVPTLYKVYSGTASWAANRALTMNAWNHLAAQKIGTTLTFYIDGAAAGSHNINTAFDASMPLGSVVQHGDEEAFRKIPGLLSHVKVSLGTVYSGTFTPRKDLMFNASSASVLYALTVQGGVPKDAKSAVAGTTTGTVVVSAQDF